MTNTKIIDCTTCKYGYEDERLGIPMCHHPKRFSEDCVNFNMHEEKDTEESEKPINPDDAMKKLDEKIALVKQRGTWDGVDVDKYMDEVRGREPEKPMNQDELEKEINRLWESFADEMEGPHNLFDIYARLARHFAEWGYLRAAEKYNEIEYNRQRAEESVPNDLEEAAWDCVLDSVDVNNPVLLPKYKELLTYLFIAGAKWAMEQFEKNRLAACDNMSKEEYDRETDFVDSIIKKEHRQPTFSDAINYGMRLQREQMLKEAVEGEVRKDGTIGYFEFSNEQQFHSLLEQFQDCDKVRIIIVKE